MVGTDQTRAHRGRSSEAAAGQDRARLGAVAGHHRLLRRRPGGGPAGGPSPHRRAAGPGAAFALAFPLGYATVGLVLALRRPATPIGWLYAASGLSWSLIIPLGPWVDQLVREQRPLPLAAQLNAMAQVTIWAPAIALGITLPALLLPDGRLRSRGWRR